jgi:hypothetical protein
MPGARQPLYPPYVLNKNYRFVSVNNPDTNILVKYIGTVEHGPNYHRFQRLDEEGGILTIVRSSTYDPDPSPPTGLYVTGEGNAGGRRKSLSRKSKRKTRRARRNYKK